MEDSCSLTKKNQNVSPAISTWLEQDGERQTTQTEIPNEQFNDGGTIWQAS